MSLDAHLIETLWEAASYYNEPGFIENDPIQIPHSFTDARDIEIAGFFTALISWGQRKTIINSAKNLFLRMDNAPYDFIVNSSIDDQKSLIAFSHRTFNDFDLILLVNQLKRLLIEDKTLENVFFEGGKQIKTVEMSLVNFHKKLFSTTEPKCRTMKHIATPIKNSACKRLNMFLRWMVRPADGVDFGIWNTVNPSVLKMPLDTHVIRVTEELGIMSKLKSDWKGCVDLTRIFQEIHPEDPVFFDFALFGIGVNNRNIS